jgi:hypothetical protein
VRPHPSPADNFVMNDLPVVASSGAGGGMSCRKADSRHPGE